MWLGRDPGDFVEVRRFALDMALNAVPQIAEIAIASAEHVALGDLGELVDDG